MYEDRLTQYRPAQTPPTPTDRQTTVIRSHVREGFRTRRDFNGEGDLILIETQPGTPRGRLTVIDPIAHTAVTTDKETGEILIESVEDIITRIKTETLYAYWFPTARPGIPASPGIIVANRTLHLNDFSREELVESPDLIGDEHEQDAITYSYGMEARRQVMLADLAGTFNILSRIYDQYRWANGILDRRVDDRLKEEVFGQRLNQDGQKLSETRSFSAYRSPTSTAAQRMPVTVLSEFMPEHATDRTESSRTLVNGWLMHSTRSGAPNLAARSLPVTVTPAWGWPTTEQYRLDAKFGRAPQVNWADGSRVTVDQWKRGTNLALISHRDDRNGYKQERFVTQDTASMVNATPAVPGTPGRAGTPVRLVKRYIASPFDRSDAGDTLMETRAYLNGTPVLFRSDFDETETYYNLVDPTFLLDGSKAFAQKPYFAVDPSGAFGRTITISGERVSNVIRISRAGVGRYWGDKSPDRENNSADPVNGEPVMRVTEVTFDGRRRPELTERAIDRAGFDLEVLDGYFVTVSDNAERIFSGEARDDYFRVRAVLFYDQGGFVPGTGAHGEKTFAFQKTGGPGVAGGAIPVNELPVSAVSPFRTLSTRSEIYRRARLPGTVGVPETEAARGQEAAPTGWLPYYGTRNYAYHEQNPYAKQLGYKWWMSQDKAVYRMEYKVELDDTRPPVLPRVTPLTTHQPVIVRGRQLLVGGTPWQIRGTTFSVTPKGRYVDDQPLSLATVGADKVAMIQQSGMNTQRTYRLPTQDLLDEFARQGIKVIVGFRPQDIADGSYQAYVQANRTHPAILMWEVGNEENFKNRDPGKWGEYRQRAVAYLQVLRANGGAGLTALQRASTNSVIQTIPAAGAVTEDQLKAVFYDENSWYLVLQLSATAIKAIDQEHPVSTANWNLPKAQWVSAVTAVDIWGINVYPWDDMSEVFRYWKQVIEALEKTGVSKAMYISETGADSQDSSMPAKDEAAQAVAVYELWRQIDEQSTIYRGDFLTVGATFMTFIDEWWKAGNPSQQDIGGFEVDVPYDGHDDPEHWGWWDIDGKPKTVARLMQRVWTQVPVGRQLATNPVHGVTMHATPSPYPRLKGSIWYNPFGQLVLSQDTGVGALRKPLTRQYYYLPQLSPLLTAHVASQPAGLVQTFPLPPGALQGQDFLYVYTDNLQGATLDLVLVDDQNRQIMVSDTVPPDSGHVKFWTPLLFNQMFFPTMEQPSAMAAAEASRNDIKKKQVWVVALPPLAKLGQGDKSTFNLNGVQRVIARINGPVPANARISAPGVLGDGSRDVSKGVEATEVLSTTVSSDGQLLGFTIRDPKGRGRLVIQSVGKSGFGEVVSVSEFEWQPNPLSWDGLLSKDVRDPEHLLLADPTKPGAGVILSPQAGYLISGMWMETKDRSGGSILSRLGMSSGFTSPMHDRMDPESVLEGLPAAIGYGSDYFVVFPTGMNIYAANINANIINFGIDALRGGNPFLPFSPEQKTLVLYRTEAENLRQMLDQWMKAEEAAADVRSHWADAASAGPQPSAMPARNQARTTQLEAILRQLTQGFAQRVRNGDQACCLVPTLLGTFMDGTTPVDLGEYAMTDDELELVLPALVRIGLVEEAQAVMEFYIRRTEDGAKPVADSYETVSGLPRLYNGFYKTPSVPPFSADSQVALVNAALYLAAETGQTRYYQFAQKAFNRLLEFNRRSTAG